jgi:hypothetical protein
VNGARPKRGRPPKSRSARTAKTKTKTETRQEPKLSATSARVKAVWPPKWATEAKMKGASGAKRGRKPKSHRATIKAKQVRGTLPGAIVTLTITGSIEAVQMALEKLQNLDHSQD